MKECCQHMLLIECIARNCPIVAPRMKSVTEYLGEDYPLLYDIGKDDLRDVITEDNVKKAVEYLELLDKTDLTQEHFVNSIMNSTIMRYIPAGVVKKEFDVTISICSYRRTHHLNRILDSLWNGQTFQGRIQIIVWNNNSDRDDLVTKICKKFMIFNGMDKSLQLIQSTENHFAVIRLALPPLIKSNKVMICDDDIIPGENFLKFFMDAAKRHPKDILCVRGHYFMKHDLKDENPEQEWINYENVRFSDDRDPERLIHFVHSDVCMIPKKALMEVASVPMPDQDFDLVDDYWTSFVANHHFGRQLRKLSTSDVPNLFIRTDDSETKGLALHTRRDVSDARLRMYTHHMLQGWPRIIDGHEALDSISDEVRHQKKALIKMVKSGKYLGFNISSSISEEDLNVLISDFGVDIVRIGAVGSQGLGCLEFQNMADMSLMAENHLVQLLERLQNKGICVILTLNDRVAEPEVWQFIASICNK